MKIFTLIIGSLSFYSFVSADPEAVFEVPPNSNDLIDSINCNQRIYQPADFQAQLGRLRQTLAMNGDKMQQFTPRQGDFENRGPRYLVSIAKPNLDQNDAGKNDNIVADSNAEIIGAIFTERTEQNINSEYQKCMITLRSA